MRIRWYNLVSAACIALGISPIVQAATPAERVDAQFGKAIADVRKTPEPTDDIALAREMLSLARRSPAADALLVTLCNEAWKLTADVSAGQRTALSAMVLLANRSRQGRIDALEKATSLQQTRLAAANGLMQRAHRATLMQLHLALADAYAQHNESSKLKRQLLTAETLAETLPPEFAKRIRRVRPRLEAALQAGQQAQQLAAALQASPDNRQARRELIELYLVAFDDPRSAEELLSPDLDATLRSYLPLLTREPDSLPPDVCSETADWLDALAQDARPAQKPPLWARAVRFRRGALSQLAPDDPARAGLIEKLQATQARPQPASNPEGWSLDPRGLAVVPDAQSHHALVLARNALLANQNADGSWPGDTHADLSTALAVYALLLTDMDPQTPSLARALTWLAEHPTTRTRALAVRCAIWRRVDDPLCGLTLPELFADADALLRGTADGSYAQTAEPDSPAREGDLRNTAWAIWGLALAERGGFDVGEAYWRRELTWLLRAQNRDGGWPELPEGPSQHVASVGAAGAMLICLDHIGRPQSEALRHGGLEVAMDWLGAYYADGKNRDPLHYLFGLARLGTALGTREIGQTDWHAWSRKDLLTHQQPDGLWAPPGHPPVISTALGILALSYPQTGP